MTEQTTPSRRTGLHDEIVKALGRIKTIPPVAHRQEQADHVLTVLYRAWPWLRAEAEDAAPAGQAPATDRAALRDRIAEALAEKFTSPGLGAKLRIEDRVDRPMISWTDGRPPEWGFVRPREVADAVLSVLPTPADRAADAERPLSPDYQHPDCGFHWHGKDGMDIPTRDGQPVCPRCELAAVEKRLRHSEKRCDELRVESKRRGKIKLEYAERIRQLENQLDEVRTQLGAEILRAGQAEAELRRMAAEEQQPDSEPEFTEAHAAFMQLGCTPSLEGLRAELRIDGYPPLIGRYTGASMGRMRDVPGHEHLLAVDPRLIFEYAAEQPAVGAQQPKETGPRSICVCGHTRGEHLTVSGRLLCDTCDPDSTDNLVCREFEAL